MPNWCQNQLTVRDATPELRAYLEANGFFFARMAPPVPPADPDDDSAAVAQQVAAWGTKWDLDEAEGRQAAEELLTAGVSYFDTAWSPPLPALLALSQSFPRDTLELCYCEDGMMFAGRAVFREGRCHNRPVTGESSVRRIARTVFGG